MLWLAGCTSPETPAPVATVVSATAADTVGLLPGPNVRLVQGHCTGCHSASLIRQNHMSRDRWDATITWMQDTQGLWPLSAEHRSAVLDYLEQVQGPEQPETESPWAQPLYAPNPAW